MSHQWKFFRAGGFDQVNLESAADLQNLKNLDQKLWVALSCPTTGIEFDERTLSLIDTDIDGHIRANELMAAVDWACERLNDVNVLAKTLPGVPLDAIKDDALIAAAKDVLPAGETMISVELASSAEAAYTARAEAAWLAAGASAMPLGDATEAASTAVAAVKEKIDDYFVRCRLAQFDERSSDSMNVAEDTFKALGASALVMDAEGIAALPLAKIVAAPGATSVGAGDTLLDLGSGINPAWAARIATLRDTALTPLLGAQEKLSEGDWQMVQDKLAIYRDWIAAKPAGLPAEAQAVKDLERLSRYVRDLMPLANNFVAFRGFYTRTSKAMFQIGTLYLDGRSAELCVSVHDAAKHASMASLSRVFLAYCECVRGGEKLHIAAAFTAGDTDQLMVGRNGVFYDRQGRDWDATITRLAEHPISLRQAFWSPYKRLARMISEQLQKMAAAKAAGVDAQMAATAMGAGNTIGAPTPPVKPPAPTAFDVGKFAGIFAAIGLAVGALGTVAAGLISGLLSLHWWQIPLAIGGLMLLISAPSIIIAWFKLQTRNLGPILDANGWAVNARARINIPFGTSLTQLAKLPEGAQRSLSDPYAEKETPWTTYLVVILIVVAAVAWFTG
ncbi:MAG: hypothetical protein IPJ25_07930 [Rhodocyclaceae bacterium]|nr:hypothetical protein [Rhodocyclaceae bacterium]